MPNPPLLSRMALNRATLARQHLLERAPLTVPQVVHALAGVQAQTPHTWYVGLWSRVAGFDPHACGELLLDRTLVRIALQRSTIHLVTADDCRWMRPLLAEVGERVVLASRRAHLEDLDLDAVAEAGRELTARRPRTFAELGRELAGRFPGRPPEALAQVVRTHVPLVQVPPRGVWGRSGPAAHVAADVWLGVKGDGAGGEGSGGEGTGGPGGAPGDVAELVRRYLAAYGPATVRDAQVWSGLRRLGEVFDALAPDLVTFRDEDGRVLYDLPEAPRPPAGAPAPARFLYEYDNLLRSHADRTRVIDVDFRDHGYVDHGPVPRAVLLDGRVAATWTVEAAGRGRKAPVTLTVVPFRRVTEAEREDLDREGRDLLAMLHPAAERHEVTVTPPRP